MIVVRTTSPAAVQPSIQSARRRYRRTASGDVGAGRALSSDRTCQAESAPSTRASQAAATSATIPAGTSNRARPRVSTCHEP